jgi:glycosyltransferase involved in cell wall biosynthesis
MSVSTLVENTKLDWNLSHKFNLLSILVPVYNERRTLRRMLERVLDAPIPMDVELIVVDDGSSDGSWEIVRSMSERDPRIRPIRHAANRGKGAALRTAIENIQGDIAVIQDADLEYDPIDLPRLMEPIVNGQADAVFGSRFRGECRRAMYFWHAVANSIITLMTNVALDLNLSDVETCYKMVRADTLRSLILKGNKFNIEIELTSRLAQFGGPIYEVPVGYAGRTYEEGKKIGLRDAFHAMWELFRCRVLDRRFTWHTGFYTLNAVAKANRYNRWTLRRIAPYLGQRVLEAGSGIGNMSKFLLDRERLILSDYEPLYIARLQRRFGHLENVRVLHSNLCNDADHEMWADEELDTVFTSNVIEHIEDDEYVLRKFYETLRPGGHCIVIVPAGEGLYTGVDAELGHYRRYEEAGMADKLRRAGFEVVLTERFNRLGSVAWWFSGKVLRRRSLSPRQMIWFDRLWPLAKGLDRILPVPGMSLLAVGRKRA